MSDMVSRNGRMNDIVLMNIALNDRLDYVVDLNSHSERAKLGTQ